MKNLLSTLLLLLLFGFNAQAAVAYETTLSGEEFEMGNLLEWSTSKEINSNIFVVEKSADGITFENIGIVSAAGNSDEERKYTHLDIGAKKETSYYRLKEMDVDGTFSYSHVTIVNKALNNNFTVLNLSSTEVFEFFEVTLDASLEQNLQYSLVSYQGEVVLTASMDLSDGLNEVVIDMAQYLPGIYKLELALEEESETLVFNKLQEPLPTRIQANNTGKK